MKKLFLSTMLLLCGFVSSQAQELDAKYAVGLLSPGTLASDMTIHSLDGGELSLSESREKNGCYQILDFWASWCPDCRKDIPKMKAIAKDYENYGVWLTGISFDTDSTAWRKCVKKNEMTWTQLSELKKWKHGTKIDSLYHVKWIPTLYLIDPDGKVVLGTVEVKRLRATIDSLIQAGKITKFMLPEFKDVTKYIAGNLHYPKIAQKTGVEGRIVVKFMVDKDGKVLSPEVSSESTYSVLPRKKRNNLSESEKTEVQMAIDALKKEALRVVQSMPAWKPAYINGRNVTTRLRVPVRFALK